jgi:hypothetical protein
VRNSVDEASLLDALAKSKQSSHHRNSTKDCTDSACIKNEIIDLTSKKSSNLSGYLWKSSDESNNNIANNGSLAKYWFSLNTLSCNLLYWNEKYEQELGKFPMGKFPLAKCTQLVKDTCNTGGHNHYADAQNDLTFKLIFHQNAANSLVLSSTSKESKSSWCEAIKYAIDHLASQCSRCKPKLVVNPMVNGATSSSLQTGIQGTLY